MENVLGGTDQQEGKVFNSCYAINMEALLMFQFLVVTLDKIQRYNKEDNVVCLGGVGGKEALSQCSLLFSAIMYLRETHWHLRLSAAWILWGPGGDYAGKEQCGGWGSSNLILNNLFGVQVGSIYSNLKQAYSLTQQLAYLKVSVMLRHAKVNWIINQKKRIQLLLKWVSRGIYFYCN